MNTIIIYSLMLITNVICIICAIYSNRIMKQTIDAYTSWMVKKEREWAHLRSRVDSTVRNASNRKTKKYYQPTNE